MAAYLSSKSAAAYLDLPVKAFNRWVKREGIRPIFLGARLRRYDPKDLDRALATIKLRGKARVA